MRVKGVKLGSAWDIIRSMEKRLDSENAYIWVRKSDGEIVSSTKWYWFYHGRKKSKQVSWYTGDRPYYSNYMKWPVFQKRHIFIGYL